jgi:hypothetical protein
MDLSFLAVMSKQTHVPLTGTELELYRSLIGSL